jgi:N-hydroxyarylamine O-acetyltransferase
VNWPAAETSPPLDLDAYLARIEYDGPRQASVPVLHALHQAHATHIPFENLDVLLGRPIRIDLESLQQKLVRDRRGGYCFEQNTLLAAALERMGFPVTRLAARVRFAAQRVLPRTHMLLRVEVDGRPWLADVGFGSRGLLTPLPFQSDQPVRQRTWSFRLEQADGLWLLQCLQQGSWMDLYAFTLEPQLAVDFEMANWFTSTHPDSMFRRLLLVQSLRPEARYFLRNRELTVERGGGAETRRIEDDDELLAVLAQTFGMAFPAGTRFPYRDTP